MAHFSDTMIKDKLYVFDSIYLTPLRFKAISYNSEELSQPYYCNTSPSTNAKIKDVQFRGKGLLYGTYDNNSLNQINLNGYRIYTHTYELNLKNYIFNNYSDAYYGLHTSIFEYANNAKQSHLQKYYETVINEKNSTVHGNSIETVNGTKAERYNNEINTIITKKNTIVLTGDKSETIQHEYNNDGTLKYNGNSNITISGVSRYDVVGIYDKDDSTLYKSGGYLNINVLKNTTLNSEANSIEASVSNYIHAKVNEISSPAGNDLNSLASITLGNAQGTGGINIKNDAYDYNEETDTYTPLNTGIKITNAGKSSIDIDSTESNINIISRTRYISLASNFYNSETEDYDTEYSGFRNYGVSLLNSGFQNSNTGIIVLNKGTKDIVVESDNSNIKLYSKAIVLENNHKTDDQQNPDEDMIYGTEIPSTGVNGQIFFKVVS